MERVGKYACMERERRFLVKEIPAEIIACSNFRRIKDQYLIHSRLRLRKVEDPQGNIIALKLTQKYALESTLSFQRLITNTYLNLPEFNQLAILAGNRLVKRRYRYDWNGIQFGVDVFETDLSGLVLAEVEAETDAELLSIPIPDFAVREVTDEAFFTGGNLAQLTSAEFQQAFQLG